MGQIVRSGSVWIQPQLSTKTTQSEDLSRPEHVTFLTVGIWLFTALALGSTAAFCQSSPGAVMLKIEPGQKMNF
jgi:hypothetical protein